MTTVTGLTASRMLDIEAASVVDGDVVGDNLILVKHDGTQINAGSVRGPQGAAGPPSSDVNISSAKPVLDVGLLGQIRAGRQLTKDDFLNMGLSTPLGLWNLSDLTDSSGNGRNLSNKGGVRVGASGVPGINGLAATAAEFTGSTTQTLYIDDDVSGTLPGAQFRIKHGSWGCWFRTSHNATGPLISKRSPSAGQFTFDLYTTNTNVSVWISFDGSGYTICPGITKVDDNRWHFAVVTYDGSYIRIYLDAVLENSVVTASSLLHPGIGPLNIGGDGGNASTTSAATNFGRIDEAFVTSDVLSDDQIRNLYCVKIPHTLGVAPTRISLNVRRRRRGGSMVVGDFSTQPLRLYNFSAGSLGDEGSNAKVLANNGGAVLTSSVDGTRDNAFYFWGSQSLSAHDGLGLPASEQLPSGLNPRSFGCWVKTQSIVGSGIIGWGGTTNVNDTKLLLNNSTGIVSASNAGDSISGPFIADGQWHHVVVTEYNAVGGITDDGIKRRLYVDGRLVGISTVLNSITLMGANRFRMGMYPDGSAGGFYGQIDSVFITNYVMPPEEIYKIYAKGSLALAPSPKNVGDHVEALTATDILATFDTLESQHQIDVGVAA